MHTIHQITIFLSVLSLLLSVDPLRAAQTNNGDALDDLIRSYAYKALVRPRTGTIYTPQLPSNITGIRANVVRLRTGSFQKRGFRHFNEFNIPSGLVQTPYAIRFCLVYQYLANWSSVYYSLPGYTFITPVLGLLAYDATDLGAKDQLKIEIDAAKRPFSIRFMNISTVRSGFIPKCVQFYTNGSYHLGDVLNGSSCEVLSLGHFSIVVNSNGAISPPPPPAAVPAPSPTAGGGGNGGFRFNKTWKIVVSLVGGFVVLLLVVMLVVWLSRLRRRRELGDMVKRSEGAEVLKSHKVGDAQLPVASMVRTRPVLENEFAS